MGGGAKEVSNESFPALINDDVFLFILRLGNVTNILPHLRFCYRHHYLYQFRVV